MTLAEFTQQFQSQLIRSRVDRSGYHDKITGESACLLCYWQYKGLNTFLRLTSLCVNLDICYIYNYFYQFLEAQSHLCNTLVHERVYIQL